MQDIYQRIVRQYWIPLVTSRASRRLLCIEDLFSNEIKFPSYYIKFPGDNSDSQLNVIATDKEIKIKTGQY